MQNPVASLSSDATFLVVEDDDILDVVALLSHSFLDHFLWREGVVILALGILETKGVEEPSALDRLTLEAHLCVSTKGGIEDKVLGSILGQLLNILRCHDVVVA